MVWSQGMLSQRGSLKRWWVRLKKELRRGKMLALKLRLFAASLVELYKIWMFS